MPATNNQTRSQSTSASGLIVGNLEAEMNRDHVNLSDPATGDLIVLDRKEAEALRDWLVEILK